MALLAGVTAAATFGACSSSETSLTTAPTSDRCQVTVTNSTSSFSASGGSASVAVSTARDCTWSVTTDANWVSIGGSTSGQGEATIGYSVAANPVPAPRSASIAVSSQKVQLSQAAAPCVFALSASSDSVPAAGGTVTVDVSTLAGCSWTAASGAPWISVAAGQSGNAAGTVRLAIAANAGAARAGQAIIAGRAFTVSQAAAATDPAPAPSPSPSPTPAPTPDPSPQKVHIEGIALVVGGSCPAVTFYVGLQRIVTDGSTEYEKKTDCRDLQSGRFVAVDGLLSNDVVQATKIKIETK